MTRVGEQSTTTHCPAWPPLCIRPQATPSLRSVSGPVRSPTPQTPTHPHTPSHIPHTTHTHTHPATCHTHPATCQATYPPPPTHRQSQMSHTHTQAPSHTHPPNHTPHTCTTMCHTHLATCHIHAQPHVTPIQSHTTHTWPPAPPPTWCASQLTASGCSRHGEGHGAWCRAGSVHGGCALA